MSRRNTTVRDNHRRTIAATKPPCAICGQPINYTLKYPHKDAYVVDHIVPLDAGGTDTLENKQAAHSRCNRAKSNKPHANIIKRSGSLTRPATLPNLYENVTEA